MRSTKLFKDVVDTLTAKFGPGEKGWWMKGVPPKVRIECDERIQQDRTVRSRQMAVLVSRELCRDRHVLGQLGTVQGILRFLRQWQKG